ncbi:hypothetical protein BGW36DRAFT_355756 [Talaromyces proteolyticus]|uniref:Uncharacterized protein n=1 Tax=Talaromyces proteolyticus TaxID=1131652 RepID=A0AAD4Q3B8_9EURO|nr:uncharacterized protein BGW36DRAFT_355756 [Talaromyces proteolyticus]KAH8701601.1 hypothetical protein BGW36DRAFT_355756 [Talaromyces proteolyticus]
MLIKGDVQTPRDISSLFPFSTNYEHVIIIYKIIKEVMITMNAAIVQHREGKGVIQTEDAAPHIYLGVIEALRVLRREDDKDRKIIRQREVIITRPLPNERGNWFDFKSRKWITWSSCVYSKNIVGSIFQVLKPHHEHIYRITKDRKGYGITWKRWCLEKHNVISPGWYNGCKDSSLKNRPGCDEMGYGFATPSKKRDHWESDDEDILLIERMSEYSIGNRTENKKERKPLEELPILGTKRKQVTFPIPDDEDVDHAVKIRRLDTSSLLMSNDRRLEAQWKLLEDCVDQSGILDYGDVWSLVFEPLRLMLENDGGLGQALLGSHSWARAYVQGLKVEVKNSCGCLKEI